MLYSFEDKMTAWDVFGAKGLTAMAHIHPHLEMIYMLEGSSTATLDEKSFLIEEGDLFLAFPNQIHSYHYLSVLKCDLYIFRPDLFPDLQKYFEKKIPLSPIIKKELLPEDTEKILKVIKEKINSENHFDVVTAKGYLQAFLGEILPLMTLTPAPTDQDSLKRLLICCSENYTEPLSLDILSAKLHLSKYYISHLFKDRLNMSLTDFLNKLRIEHACTLLKGDTSITEVAFSSGFSSVRTFNRSFVRYMGITPREYLKQKPV